MGRTCGFVTAHSYHTFFSLTHRHISKVTVSSFFRNNGVCNKAHSIIVQTCSFLYSNFTIKNLTLLQSFRQKWSWLKLIKIEKCFILVSSGEKKKKKSYLFFVNLDSLIDNNLEIMYFPQMHKK